MLRDRTVKSAKIMRPVKLSSVVPDMMCA